MIEKTFKEWNKAGYRIMEGSKAIGFNENHEALFSSSQVYLWVCTGKIYDGNNIMFGDDENPDPMDYDLGLCGQI